jgi:hypothetical protein
MAKAKKTGGLIVMPTLSWSQAETIAAERQAIHDGKLPADRLPKGSDSDSITNSASFAGTADMTEARGFMAGGWMDGTKAVADGLDKVMTEMALEPTWSHDVAGAFVDVAAYVAGDAECMWVRENDEAPKPRIRLVFNTSYPCNIDAKNVMRYAIALAAVVRKVEAEGMECEVVALDSKAVSGQDEGQKLVAGIEVRKFGQPLDLSKVAFAAHPSFLRRIVFACREMNGDYPLPCRSMGYAYAAKITRATVEAGYTEGADAAVILPEISNLAPKLRAHEDILKVAVPAMLQAIREAIEASKV